MAKASRARIKASAEGKTHRASSSTGKSVGIKVTRTGELIEIVKRGLPYAAITTLHRESGLSMESIARIAEISPRSLARRKSEGRFTQFESERLLRLGGIYEKALELFEGDRSAAQRWLDEPAKAFGGETPLNMTTTEVGAREVEDLIGRLEYGVFS